MTILNWSFPRKDVSRRTQAFQLALALRKEMVDLEAAGCKVIQVCTCFWKCHMMFRDLIEGFQLALSCARIAQGDGRPGWCRL